jgi:PASTA domain
VSAPESMRRRVAAGPNGAGMPPGPRRGSRLTAALVAIAVFVAAGTFAFRAFSGDTSVPRESSTPTSNPSPNVPPGALVIVATIDPGDPPATSITASIDGQQIDGVTGDHRSYIVGEGGSVTASSVRFNGEDYIPVLEATPVVVQGNADTVVGDVSNVAVDNSLVKIADLDVSAGLLPDVRPGNHVLTIEASWRGLGYSAERTYYLPLRFMALTVPDVIGMDEQEAFGTLNDLGLLPASANYREVSGVDRWHVASQDPPAGGSVTRDTVVEVVIATEITPLPEGAAAALDCPASEHVPFGGPRIRILPGGSAYIVGNVGGIELSDDVVQATSGAREWEGVWHVVRDGNVVAVVDFGTLDGEACRGSGVGGA